MARRVSSFVRRIGSARIRVCVSMLSNGVTVASAYNPQATGVSLGIGVRHGSRYETRKSNGASHVIEHMIFKGNAATAARTLSEAVEYAGGDFNASTRRESTLYELRTQTWTGARKIFPLYAGVIVNPLFYEAELEKEKSVVLTELRYLSHDAVEDYAEDAAFALLFPESAVGLTIDGTAENVAGFSREYLLDVHRRYYTPRRLIVVGGGVVRHEELLRLAEESLGGLSQRRINDHFRNEAARRSGRVEHVTARASNTSSYLLLAVNVSPILEQPADQCPFAVLASMLGNGCSSRLFQALRERHGIGYGVEAWHDIGKHYAAVFFQVALRSANDLDRAERIIIEEISRLRREQPPLREVRGHRCRLRSEIRRDVDDADTLRDDLFRVLIAHEPKHLADEPERSSDGLKRLYTEYHELQRVTPSDIRRVAEAHLDTENYAVIRVEGGSS